MLKDRNPLLTCEKAISETLDNTVLEERKMGSLEVVDKIWLCMKDCEVLKEPLNNELAGSETLILTGGSTLSDEMLNAEEIVDAGVGPRVDKDLTLLTNRLKVTVCFELGDSEELSGALNKTPFFWPKDVDNCGNLLLGTDILELAYSVERTAELLNE